MSTDLPHDSVGPHHHPGVLIAARTPLTRLGLAADLEKAGFTVFTAASGTEALDEYVAHRQEVDVLLVEAGLPDLPAPAFYARLKAHLPKLPCCFFAGSGGMHVAEQAWEMGATVVFWPVQMTELAETLLTTISRVM